MKELKKLFLFCLISCCFLSFVKGQSHYYFNQISVSEGLSQSTVYCTFFDSKGFLWIGTKSGLNRYDSYQLRTYRNNISKEPVLPSNVINYITEDGDSNLWVATEFGLSKYDYVQDAFTEVLFKDKPLRIYDSEILNDGVLFGGVNGLYWYDYLSKEMSPFKPTAGEDGVPQDGISSILRWSDHLYVIGTRYDGGWLLNLSTKEIRRFDFCSFHSIQTYYVDMDGILWVSPYGKGVIGYSKNGEELYRFNTSNSDLSNDVILDIIDRDGEIWFATDGGGISIWNKKTRDFSQISHVPGDDSSLPVNSIISLYKDAENQIWAGSVRGGLIGIREVFMRNYKDVTPNSPYGLTEKSVLSLYEDYDKRVWIGTDGGGINCLDPLIHEFRHFQSTLSQKVVSLSGYDKDHILYSVFSKGLYLLNKKTGGVEPFLPFSEEEHQQIFNTGFAVNIEMNGKDSLFLFARDLFFYDLKTRKLKNLNTKDLSINLPSRKVIRSKHNPVYYMANLHNIFSINVYTHEIESLYEKEGDERIQTIAEGVNNELWIGTNMGLKRLNTLTGTISIVETKVFREVEALVYSPIKGLWIGAHGSLYNYLPEKDVFRFFGKSEGVLPNEYLAKPTLISNDSTIFMGGVTGLLQIDSDIDLLDTQEPDLILSELILDGIPSLDKIRNNTIAIPWNYSSIQIRVLPKGDDIFRERIYRFSVEGLNDKNIFLKENALSLYTLPIGNYTVKVSCTTKNGSWTKPVHLLYLNVTPPWWKTTWARILWICLALLLWYSYYKYSLIKRKREELAQQFQEKQLKSEERIRFLINVSHELRTPLTLVYAPLRRLLDVISPDNVHHKALQGIFQQAEHMKSLVNNVLDIKVLERKENELILNSVHISTFINTFIQNFKIEFEAKDIELKVDIQVDGYIQLDQAKCEIILSNYLMNALKFSPIHSVVRLYVTSIDTKIQFGVEDEGIGLSDYDIANVFTRYYRGSHAVEGSGIGLSYVKKLAEVQQGEVGVENNSTKGAHFWLTLPLLKEKTEVEDDPVLNLDIFEKERALNSISRKVSTNNIELKDFSLAIVEDDRDLSSFLADNYMDVFGRIDLYKDGKEALEGILKKNPDIIVSDVMMPRMDGFDLCKNVKQSLNISHIPVILLTARVDALSKRMGYKVGADAYIAKPFDAEVLLRQIHNILFTREQIKDKLLSSGNVIDPIHSTFSPSDELFISNLNEIIHKNINSPKLDVSFITEQIGMSRASLYNKLKAIGGLGVNDYIIACKIDRACELLINTDDTIGEVSDSLGFSNQRYFSTVFKQVKGSTPSAYRKAMRR